MKILMLGWELPPHNSGGLGVACYQLCKALASRGADIEFILPYTSKTKYPFMKVTPANPRGVVEVLRSGIAYDSYKYLYSDGRQETVGMFGQQQYYEQSVESMVETREFDVIHAHDWLTFRAAMRAKQRSNKPLILHVHSIERDRAGGSYGNPVVREIEYLAMMMADKVIAVSRRTKNMIIEDYAIPADKIDVVHNSLDLSDVEELDPDNAYRYLSRMKQEGYRVVVNIGRLTVQKGLNNLVRAAAQVSIRAPKTIFLFVGSGELYHELIELSAELGIADKVLFTGFARGKTWRDAYAIADLFVMPSVSEPFGLTPLEAIGYGAPVLISKQSGVSEVLVNCLKADFWDINEMANQIVSVVNNDSLRDELHENSFKEYQRLTWSNAADKMMSLYKQHHMEFAA